MARSYTSRLPTIAARGAVGTRLAIEEAGHEVEAEVRRRMTTRRRSGRELESLRFRRDRQDPYTGYVIAGEFYTRFHEYGTVHESAQPALGPAAETAEGAYVDKVQRAWYG